jgi:hypothetical protein
MARVGHGLPKITPGLPCPTLLRLASGSPQKRPHDHCRGSLPAGRAACSHLLPLRTPHPVCPWGLHDPFYFRRFSFFPAFIETTSYRYFQSDTSQLHLLFHAVKVSILDCFSVTDKLVFDGFEMFFFLFVKSDHQ